jgi:hypothetical protein
MDAIKFFYLYFTFNDFSASLFFVIETKESLGAVISSSFKDRSNTLVLRYFLVITACLRKQFYASLAT